MTTKNKPASRWRVVWAIEYEGGRTNGVDFVNAPDGEEAALAVCRSHQGSVITYVEPDTRDPLPRNRALKP